MRLLTNDEMLAVSGGDINGQDDPTSLNGNPGQRGRGRNNGNGNGGRKNRYQQISDACPDGDWERTGPKVEVNAREGTGSYQGETVRCDRGNDSSDNGGGNDSGNDDD